MDIKDLEELAADQHADLQDKVVDKKAATDSPTTPAPAQSEEFKCAEVKESSDKLEEATAATSDLNSISQS